MDATTVSILLLLITWLSGFEGLKALKRSHRGLPEKREAESVSGS